MAKSKTWFWLLACALVVQLGAWSFAHASDRVTLSMATNADTQPYLIPAVERFMALNPSIEIELLTWSGTGMGTEEFVITNQLAGTPVDIFEVGSPIISGVVSAGLSMDITDYLERDPDLRLEDFVPVALGSYLRDGRLHALPTEVRMHVLSINLIAFDEMGLAHPELLGPADWTWERVAEKGRRLTVFDSEGNVQKQGMGNLQVSTMFNIIHNHGGRIVDDLHRPTQSFFNRPEVVDVLDWVQELYWPTPYTIWSGSTFNGRANMDLRMTSATTARIIDTDYVHDIAPWPHGRDNDGMYMSSTGMVINSATPNPDAAYAFLKYLLMSEEFSLGTIQNRMRASAYIPHIPLYVPGNFPEGIAPGTRHFTDFLLNPHTIHLPAFDDWHEIESEFGNRVRQELITGQAAAATLMEHVQSLASAIIARLPR